MQLVEKRKVKLLKEDRKAEKAKDAAKPMRLFCPFKGYGKHPCDASFKDIGNLFKHLYEPVSDIDLIQCSPTYIRVHKQYVSLINQSFPTVGDREKCSEKVSKQCGAAEVAERYKGKAKTSTSRSMQ